MGKSRAIVQQLLDGLSSFCAANGLTVSLSKTKWLLGGGMPTSWDPGELRFEGRVLERVTSFRYLGLEFSGSPSYPAMSAARLAVARRSWGALQG